MNIQNNVSFQGYVPQSEKRKNTVVALTVAPVLVAGCVASAPLVNKSLRAGNFKNTMKNTAKAFTKDWIELLSKGAKNILRQPKWADKIAKCAENDKRIFAAGFVIESLAAVGLGKLIADLGSKFRHRNDY